MKQKKFPFQMETEISCYFEMETKSILIFHIIDKRFWCAEKVFFKNGFRCEITCWHIGQI